MPGPVSNAYFLGDRPLASFSSLSNTKSHEAGDPLGRPAWDATAPREPKRIVNEHAEARRAKAAADGAAEAAQAAGASEAKVRALEEQVKQLEDEMLEKDGLVNILRDNLREQETSFTAS